MRVLHFFKTYLPDSFTGVERVIWQIAESTAPLGVKTDVLSLSRTAQQSPLPVDGHYSHQARLDLYVASTGLSLSVFSAFASLAAKADIVHYHFPWPMMDLVHLLTRVNKPSVVTYHSDVVRQKFLLQLYRPLMHGFLGSVDRIVATSPNYLQSSPVLQHYRNKVSLIPIGIADMTAQPDQGRARHWRERLGDRFFLFLGALRYYKGLPFLLDAARKTGLPLVIAGSGDGAELVSNAGLDTITLLGEVDELDKEALLGLCTAFVFPSHLRSEAFGVALLEAARAGKAMISCEIGTGTSFVNLDGVTGLTIAPADADQLAQAMSTLWQAPEQTRQMGINARSRYEELFTAQKMGQAYHALYSELLAEKGQVRTP